MIWFIIGVFTGFITAVFTIGICMAAKGPR